MNTFPPEVAAAFRQAAITALQELVQVEVFDQTMIPESHSGPVLIATIHFLRESLGKLSLVLPEDTATNLATRYLPAGTEVTAEMVDDVAGEFANVIAGQAKTMLKGTPFHFKQTTPAVTRATSLGVAAPAAAAVELSTELGTVLLLIDMAAKAVDANEST